MSVLHENICRLDVQLDKLKQQVNDVYSNASDSNLAEAREVSDNQIAILSKVIDSLSVMSRSRPLLDGDEIAKSISKLQSRSTDQHISAETVSAHAMNLYWLAAGKATVQTLGLILNTLLEQALVLDDEILYWEDTLGSPWYLGFYTLQTSPLRLWHNITKTNQGSLNSIAPTGSRTTIGQGVHVWIRGIIRQGIHADHWRCLRTTLLSVFAGSKSEIRRKRDSLKSMKSFNAIGIGILVREFSSSAGDDLQAWTSHKPDIDTEWRGMVSRGVCAMEIFLRKGLPHSITPDCTEGILTAIDLESNSYQTRHVENPFGHPENVVKRLNFLLQELLPEYIAGSTMNVSSFGRPSRLVRFWLPLSIGAFSASTVLKMIYSRRYELVNWISDIGSTTVDFWKNWVIEPVQKLIGTIRHDDASEIALMSKNSLEADRASLERMVIDFVLDHDVSGRTGNVADTDIIANKVREGDLTPVLKAYEKDLRSPFIGTLRGDLVRALLIQIQKTKVDVEIAIGGIDALLRSQELVFGFVGLTPGILVSYACSRWLWSTFGNRKGLRMGRQQDELRHTLRNVHRTLTLPPTSVNGTLTYQGHGLLICEIETMLRKGKMILKRAEFSAFQQDSSDLVNEPQIHRQISIVERIAWTYSKWMQ